MGIETPEIDIRDGIPRNLLINGAEGLSQREGLAFTKILGTSTNEQFHFDRWLTGGGANFSSGNLEVTDPIGGPGFVLSGRPLGRIQRYEVTATEGAPAANQAKLIEQRIEGATLKIASALAGKPFLFSFWMNATPGLILPFFLRSSSDGSVQNANYVFSITSVAGWTQYSTIIAPNEITSIHNGNNFGISFGLSFHTGSDFEESILNSWQSGTNFSFSGASNFMDTNGNFIELDQLMLVPSLLDLTAPFIPHSYEAGGELRGMQRYFHKTLNLDLATVDNLGSEGGCIMNQPDVVGPFYFQFSPKYPVRMRTNPTINFHGIHQNNNNFSNLTANNDGGTGGAVTAIGDMGFIFGNQGNFNTTTVLMGIHYSANAEI